MTSTVTLTRNLTTKVGRFTDTTDYSAYDLSAANAVGLGTIKFQGEIIIQKTNASDPLIDLGAGDTYFEFPLELDANDDVANGVYELTYSVNMSPSGLAISSISATGNQINGNGNGEYADFLEAGDTINIPAGPNAGNKTIEEVSNVSGNLIINVTQTLTNESPTGATLNFDVTHQTFSDSWTSGSCTFLTPSATFSYDCTYGANGTWSVTNGTPITTQTLVSLTGNIYWPSLTDLAPIAITSLPYSNNTLATGSYAINFTQVISQVESDGLITVYSINFAQEFDPVICTSDLCGLMECFANLLAAHLAALESSKVSQYQASYDAAVGYIEEYRTYMSCAENAKALAALAKLKLVLDSSGCDCGCCNDQQGSIWVNNYSVTSLVEWGLFDGVPSVNQDTNHGYQEGSKLCDINTGITYTCDNPANGAAEWSVYYDPSAASNPTLQQVVTAGNEIENSDGEYYMILNNTNGDQIGAVWNESDEGVVFETGQAGTTATSYYKWAGITHTSLNNDGSILKTHSVIPAGSTTTNVGFGYCVADAVPDADWDINHGWQVNSVVRVLITGLEYRCDDNTNGAAVWVRVNPYLYWVNVTQTSTNNPDVNVLKNSTGAIINAARTTTGTYTLTASIGIFDENNTSILIGLAKQTGGFFAWHWESGTVITLYSFNASGVLSDDVFDNTTIKIEIPV